MRILCRRTVRLSLGFGFSLVLFVEVLLPFLVRGAAQLPVSLLAAELELEVADAAAQGAAEVGDAAGADYEEDDEEYEQDLKDTDANQ